ncbi:MAG: RsmB/NOP family class I SAM-dependent RNA methyltransferase [Magnetovibrionaceae bacterium]
MPRLTASRLLYAILVKNQPLDDAFATEPRMPHLEARDKAFARALVLCCLRHLGQIDALIDSCLERPLPKSGQSARMLLRLGVAQMAFFDVPDHAAISTTVEMSRHPKSKAAAFSKLINAVLRRLQREGLAELLSRIPADANEPDWLIKDWRAYFGDEVASAIAAANALEPATDLTIKPGLDPASQAVELGGTPTALGQVTLPTGIGAIEKLPGYAKGNWWVQDRAAALPARLLGGLADKRVADLCAAPGGKTLQLAAQGARVTALDRSAKRLKRLKENLKRCHLSGTVQVVTADAARWRPEDPLDAVLLDAPCSATGTLRRHPDIRFSKSEADVAKLARVQADLLTAAFEMLKPGGTLVYCVCSMQASEGPGVIEPFRDRLDPISAADIPGLEDAAIREGCLVTRPDLGMDGFFAARFRK